MDHSGRGVDSAALDSIDSDDEDGESTVDAEPDPKRRRLDAPGNSSIP